jgi:GDP-D-mannose 3', 5'-epimerase
MHNSETINLNVLASARKGEVGRIFFSSSACIYPERNQLDPAAAATADASAYPAAPDSEYGRERLFSKRLYSRLRAELRHDRTDWSVTQHCRPEGTWRGRREKAPASIGGKVAEAEDPGAVEIWGDELQTRSFLYVSECIDGVRPLMESAVDEPVNIGSEEMINLNDFARMAINMSGKELAINNVTGPTDVRGCDSYHTLIRERLGWAPCCPLREGIE